MGEVYRARDTCLGRDVAIGALTAVPVALASGAQTVEVGTPVALFTPPTAVGAFSGAGGDKQQYAVTPDGQRFLVNVSTDEGSTSPITVILNWPAGLGR